MDEQPSGIPSATAAEQKAMEKAVQDKAESTRDTALEGRVSRLESRLGQNRGEWPVETYEGGSRLNGDRVPDEVEESVWINGAPGSGISLWRERPQQLVNPEG